MHIAPLSRKRKRSDTPPQVQENVFDERLAVKYKVKPWKYWKLLRRYKSFTGKKADIVYRPNDLMTLLTDGENSGI